MFKLIPSSLLIVVMLAVPSLSQADAEGQLSGTFCRNLLSHGVMSAEEAQAIRSYTPGTSGESQYPTPHTALSSLIIRDAALFNDAGQAYARRLRFINDNCQKVCQGLPIGQGLSCERVREGGTAERFEAAIEDADRFAEVTVTRDLQTIGEVDAMLSLEGLFAHQTVSNPEPEVVPEVAEQDDQPEVNTNSTTTTHDPNGIILDQWVEI